MFNSVSNINAADLNFLPCRSTGVALFVESCCFFVCFLSVGWISLFWSCLSVPFTRLLPEWEENLCAVFHIQVFSVLLLYPTTQETTVVILWGVFVYKFLQCWLTRTMIIVALLCTHWRIGIYLVGDNMYKVIHLDFKKSVKSPALGLCFYLFRGMFLSF